MNKILIKIIWKIILKIFNIIIQNKENYHINNNNDNYNYNNI